MLLNIHDVMSLSNNLTEMSSSTVWAQSTPGARISAQYKSRSSGSRSGTTMGRSFKDPRSRRIDGHPLSPSPIAGIETSEYDASSRSTHRKVAKGYENWEMGPFTRRPQCDVIDFEEDEDEMDGFRSPDQGEVSYDGTYEPVSATPVPQKRGGIV